MQRHSYVSDTLSAKTGMADTSDAAALLLQLSHGAVPSHSEEGSDGHLSDGGTPMDVSDTSASND